MCPINVLIKKLYYTHNCTYYNAVSAVVCHCRLLTTESSNALRFADASELCQYASSDSDCDDLKIQTQAITMKHITTITTTIITYINDLDTAAY